MSNQVDVTTGDKIKGKLKEGFGKITGDKEMKEEGKAVKKVSVYYAHATHAVISLHCSLTCTYCITQVEKNAEKVDDQTKKVMKQNDKVYENAAKGGVSDPSNVGVGEKLVGGIKENVGSLFGNKDMEKEGKAVRKTEEAHEKASKEADKLADKQADLNKQRLKADL